MIEEYKKILKSKMGEKRYIHSVNVYKMAIKLAKIYKADENKAAVAGILHDIMKEVPKGTQLEVIEKAGVTLSEIEFYSPKLLHSISGAIYVRENLNIRDSDILNAIKYHTTGRKNMSLLEKIIFMADAISDDREYNNAKYMRNLAFKDLDAGLIFGLRVTIEGLLAKNKLISLNTLDAYNYTLLKNER